MRIVWSAVIALITAGLAAALSAVWVLTSDVPKEVTLPVLAVVSALISISFAMLALREPR